MSASRESEEHFSLQWNNFHSNLSEGFHLLQKAEDLVDVTLAAGSKYVQAHRLVLSVCSPYFKELFRVNPCKHPTVILKDVSFQELVDILEFMYRGQVNVQQDRLSEFLKTAEMLQVKGLSEDDTSVNPLLANMSSSVPVQAPAKKIPTPITQKKPEFKESTSAQYNEASSPPVKRKRRATQPETYSAPRSFNEELVIVSKPYNDDTSDEVELINIIEPKEEVNLEDDESNVEEGETNQDGKPSFSNIFNDDNGFPGQNISDSQFELDFPSNSQTVVGVHGVNEGLLEPFLRQFQTESPVAPFLHSALFSLVHTLMVRFVKEDAIKKNFLSPGKLILITDNLLHAKNVDVGFAVRDALQKAKRVKELQILEFKQCCRQALTQCTTKLLDKSPLKFRLTEALTFLDPAVASKSVLFKKNLASCLEILVKHNWLSGVQADSIQRELHLLLVRRSDWMHDCF